jgi:hypothetical protein
VATPPFNPALANIVKAVIVSTRPEEMILVDTFFQNPNKAEREEMLGFGMGIDVALLTPLLISFLREAGKGALNELASDVGKKIAKQFTSEKESTLNTSALQKIQEAFSLHLENAGFSPTDTLQVSDSLVTVLVSHPEWLQGLVKN